MESKRKLKSNAVKTSHFKVMLNRKSKNTRLFVRAAVWGSFRCVLIT